MKIRTAQEEIARLENVYARHLRFADAAYIRGDLADAEKWERSADEIGAVLGKEPVCLSA